MGKMTYIQKKVYDFTYSTAESLNRQQILNITDYRRKRKSE